MDPSRSALKKKRGSHVSKTCIIPADFVSGYEILGIVSICRPFLLMLSLENRNWPWVEVPHLPLPLQAKPSNIRHHNLQKNQIVKPVSVESTGFRKVRPITTSRIYPPRRYAKTNHIYPLIGKNTHQWSA